VRSSLAGLVSFWPSSDGLLVAIVQSGSVTVSTLGTNEVMFSGNLIAILYSAVIHNLHLKFVDPQNYDFSELNDSIKLVEKDLHGLGLYHWLLDNPHPPAPRFPQYVPLIEDQQCIGRKSIAFWQMIHAMDNTSNIVHSMAEHQCNLH
jgi:hypothetical protein